VSSCHQSPLTAHNELTDEERSILAFAEADLIKRCMKMALAMVRNTDIELIDLRTVIDGYRDRWRRLKRGQLKLVRR